MYTRIARKQSFHSFGSIASIDFITAYNRCSVPWFHVYVMPCVFSDQQQWRYACYILNVEHRRLDGAELNGRGRCLTLIETVSLTVTGRPSISSSLARSSKSSPALGVRRRRLITSHLCKCKRRQDAENASPSNWINFGRHSALKRRRRSPFAVALCSLPRA